MKKSNSPRRALFILFILLLCGPVYHALFNHPAAIADTIENIDEESLEVRKEYIPLESVVQLHSAVKTHDGFLLISTATGFSIDWDRKTGESKVLTNHHFCDVSRDELPMEGEVVFFYTRGDSGPNSYFEPDGILDFVAMNEEDDLCLLTSHEKIKPLKLSKISPKVGSEVKTLGGPDGIFPIFSKMYISGFIKRERFSMESMNGDGRELIFLSGIIIPGASGSPLLNERGHVVGIIFSTSPGVFGGCAVQSKDIIDWLDELK